MDSTIKIHHASQVTINVTNNNAFADIQDVVTEFDILTECLGLKPSQLLENRIKFRLKLLDLKMSALEKEKYSQIQPETTINQQ